MIINSGSTSHYVILMTTHVRKKIIMLMLVCKCIEAKCLKVAIPWVELVDREEPLETNWMIQDMNDIRN